MNRYVIAACLASLGCASSDPADTCTQGDNMTAPRLVGRPEATESETELRIAWDRGTVVGERLPASYFEQVSLEERKVATRATSVGEREIAVFLSGVPAAHGGKTETFTLIFPDRNRFTDCRHPGMSDVYELDVAVTFSADGATATAAFEQKIARGPI
jgi:hypothetical protein